jgi:hypothetical protein
MPTRKQRRRRQKEQRHDYEYVYVDDEGRELEADPEEPSDRSPRRNGKADAKRATQKNTRSARPVRPVPPPSWQRVAKRALFFGPLIFLAFSVINSDQSLAGRFAVAAVYTAFFIPFMYLMDRALYRSYLRRSGQEPAKRPPRRR